MAKTNVRGAQIADGNLGVDLTVDVFNTLPVANGGTGISSLTSQDGKVLTVNVGGTAFVLTTPSGGAGRTFAFFAG